MAKSAQHSRAARIMHSRYNARETTAAARRASATSLRERLLNEVDPNRELPEEERERRYDHAYHAHWQWMGQRSWAAARRAQKG